MSKNTRKSSHGASSPTHSPDMLAESPSAAAHDGVVVKKKSGWGISVPTTVWVGTCVVLGAVACWLFYSNRSLKERNEYLQQMVGAAQAEASVQQQAALAHSSSAPTHPPSCPAPVASNHSSAYYAPHADVAQPQAPVYEQQPAQAYEQPAQAYEQPAQAYEQPVQAYEQPAPTQAYEAHVLAQAEVAAGKDDIYLTPALAQPVQQTPPQTPQPAVA